MSRAAKFRKTTDHVLPEETGAEAGARRWTTTCMDQVSWRPSYRPTGELLPHRCFTGALDSLSFYSSEQTSSVRQNF